MYVFLKKDSTYKYRAYSCSSVGTSSENLRFFRRFSLFLDFLRYAS